MCKLWMNQKKIQVQNIMPDVEFVCARHLRRGIERFSFNQKHCVDPLNIHKTLVKTNLCAVSKDVYTQYGSLLGFILCQKLCKKCLYNHLPDCYKTNQPAILTQASIWASSASAEFSLSPFINSQLAMEHAREDLTTMATTLQISPIQASDRAKKRYLEDHFEAIHRGIQKRFKIGANFELAAKGDAVEAQHHREMIDQLKEKISNSTTAEKYLALSILPKSWSANKIHNEFGVSRHLAETIKKLVDEQGILVTPPLRRGKTLDDHVVKSIDEFYNSDEVSRALPGKKDCVTYRVNGEKKELQKRLMLFTLRDAHNLFVELSEESEHIVGFSKFASLRPQHCVLPGTSGTHSICVCTIHQNRISLLNALNLESLKTECVEWSTEDILKRMICDSSTELCFTGQCTNCPGAKAVVNDIESLLKKNSIASVGYQQWVQTDRSNLETKKKRWKSSSNRSNSTWIIFFDMTSLQRNNGNI